MEINSPLCITSRLLPGCRIGGAELSIEYAPGPARDGRQYYHWRIDLQSGHGGGEFENDDIASGVGGGTLQEGLESLLCFLGAFAEAQSYTALSQQRTGRGENANLFSDGLAEWAIENADAITMMELELVENPGKLIIE